MFGKDSKQLELLSIKVIGLETLNGRLTSTNKALTQENALLKQKITRFTAIKGGLIDSDIKQSVTAKPASTPKEAVKQLEELVDMKFALLFDADLEPLNIFINKISRLINGDYKPSQTAISSCDDFFDFNKRVSRSKRINMLYSFLDIKITSRRFETFNNELCNDEIVKLLEKLFSLID